MLGSLLRLFRVWNLFVAHDYPQRTLHGLGTLSIGSALLKHYLVRNLKDACVNDSIIRKGRSPSAET